MANEQRLFISASSFGASLKRKKLMGVGIEEFLKRGTGLIIRPFRKHFAPQISLEVALIFHCFADFIWQCSSRSAFIICDRMVDTISTTQYNELQNVFVCCPHIPPNLCICDAAALLSFRPGSLRAWIFLLESPYAPRQQVPLMMGNYACGTSIMLQKYSGAAVYHFWRLSISLIRGFP